VLVGAAWVVWRSRPRPITAPLAVLTTWLHLVHEANVLPSPRSSLEWGATAVAVGFLLLFASLVTSWMWARKAPKIAGDSTEREVRSG
jgi:hypothetical protein